MGPRLRLRFESGDRSGETVDVPPGTFVIGRERDSDLVLADPEVSRHHARIQLTPRGEFVIEDQGSTNGTRVDGERLSGPATLRPGQSLRVGDTVLAVDELEPGIAPTAVRPLPGTAGPERTVTGRPQPPARPPEPEPARPADAAAAAAAAPPPTTRQPPATPAQDRSASRIQSAIERVKLQRSVRRALALAGAALTAVVVILVLVIAGVIGGSDSSPTVEQVVAKAKPSTVKVITKHKGKTLGWGTGWVVDAGRGLVVTNGHVVNGGDAFDVAVEDKARSARVVSAAPCEDLALIKVSRTAGLKQLPLGSQSSLHEGQSVVVVGYPDSASVKANLTSTAGIVSVVRTQLGIAAQDGPLLTNAIQTDAAINPGNSGGPLLNLKGQIVGVNTATNTKLQSQGYAIGVDRVKTVVTRLEAGKSLGWTGMGFTFATPSKLSEQGLPAGLVVSAAVPGTPAAKAGLGKSDVLLTKVNGHALDTTLSSYCKAVKGIETGSSAIFSFVTGTGAVKNVSMKFA